MNGINPYGVPLDELAAPSDNTTNNATVSAHGLLPKLSGDADEFLDGTGAWSAVSAGPSMPSTGTDRAVQVRDGTGQAIEDSLLTVAETTGVVSAKGSAASVAAFASDGTKNVAISHDGTNSCVTSSAGSVKLVPQAGAYGTILSDSILRVPSTFQVQTTGGGVMYDVSQKGLFRLIDATVGGLKYFGLAPLAGGVGAEINNGTAGTLRDLTCRAITTTGAINGMSVSSYTVRSSSGTALHLIGSSAGVELGNYGVALATVKPNSANGTTELQYFLTANTSIKEASAGLAEVNTGTAGTLATLTALIRPAPYTFATVPTAASHTGSTIRITDRAQRQAYSDGTNWRFVADDVIIS